jgi:hypothetical protein
VKGGFEEENLPHPHFFKLPTQVKTPAWNQIHSLGGEIDRSKENPKKNRMLKLRAALKSYSLLEGPFSVFPRIQLYLGFVPGMPHYWGESGTRPQRNTFIAALRYSTKWTVQHIVT